MVSSVVWLKDSVSDTCADSCSVAFSVGSAETNGDDDVALAGYKAGLSFDTEDDSLWSAGALIGNDSTTTTASLKLYYTPIQNTKNIDKGAK